MSEPVKISTVLTRAAKYIEEHGLAKGAFFKYRNGRRIDRKDGETWAEAVQRAKEKGCKACALGAIYVGTNADDGQIETVFNEAAFLVERTVSRWPSYWNDEPDRTQDEVVQALKDAAKAARKDGK